MADSEKNARSSTRRTGIRPKVIGTVSVPDTPASELFAQAMEALAVTNVNEAFRNWDFFADQDGRDLGYGGTTYEVASWKKGRSGSMDGDELRSRFRALGYAGVVPALLVWLIEHQPRDAVYGTLPEEHAKCRYTHQGRSLVASLFHYRDRSGSRLYAITPPHKCSPGEVYLAFREVAGASGAVSSARRRP